MLDYYLTSNCLLICGVWRPKPEDIERHSIEYQYLRIQIQKIVELLQHISATGSLLDIGADHFDLLISPTLQVEHQSMVPDVLKIVRRLRERPDTSLSVVESIRSFENASISLGDRGMEHASIALLSPAIHLFRKLVARNLSSIVSILLPVSKFDLDFRTSKDAVAVFRQLCYYMGAACLNELFTPRFDMTSEFDESEIADILATFSADVPSEADPTNKKDTGSSENWPRTLPYRGPAADRGSPSSPPDSRNRFQEQSVDLRESFGPYEPKFGSNTNSMLGFSPAQTIDSQVHRTMSQESQHGTSYPQHEETHTPYSSNHSSQSHDNDPERALSRSPNTSRPRPQNFTTSHSIGHQHLNCTLSLIHI